jgi:hypothetical protein
LRVVGSMAGHERLRRCCAAEHQRSRCGPQGTSSLCGTRSRVYSSSAARYATASSSHAVPLSCDPKRITAASILEGCPFVPVESKQQGIMLNSAIDRRCHADIATCLGVGISALAHMEEKPVGGEPRDDQAGPRLGVLDHWLMATIPRNKWTRGPEESPVQQCQGIPRRRYDNAG